MGAPPDRHGRPRPRLHDRQHLRQPAAPDAGRSDSARRLGAPLLRDRASSVRPRCRRAAGHRSATARDSSTRSTARTRSSWTRCGRSARWRSATGWGTCCSRKAASESRCSTAWCVTLRSTATYLVSDGPRPRHLRRSRPRHTRGDLQRRAPARSAASARSRATRRSPPGRAASPGPCAALPSSSSSWRRCPAPTSRPKADEAASSRSCAARRAMPATTTSSSRPLTASRTGTPARPASRASATTARRPPIHSTSSSRSTVPPRRSRHRASSASAITCGGAMPPAATATGRLASP